MTPEQTLEIAVPDTTFWRNGLYMLRILSAAPGAPSEMQLLHANRVAMQCMAAALALSNQLYAGRPCDRYTGDSCLQRGMVLEDCCGPCIARDNAAKMAEVS